jgi:alkylation response protein AidB-like acyl-CoA dehydrogenase
LGASFRARRPERARGVLNVRYSSTAVGSVPTSQAVGSGLREVLAGSAGLRAVANRSEERIDSSTKESPVANFSEIPWIAEHIELYRTDPDKARMWDSTPLGGPGLLPTLLLTTKGRKSGEPRALPLIYGEAGDSYVIIASKGGLPNHPIWYLNLEATPG